MIVESRQVLDAHNDVITKKGERFLVMLEHEGWVEATSQRIEDSDAIHKDAKIFDTPEEAKAFIKRWEGHPWWCVPNGKYELVEVTPRYVQVFSGWERRRRRVERDEDLDRERKA